MDEEQYQLQRKKLKYLIVSLCNEDIPIDELYDKTHWLWNHTPIMDYYQELKDVVTPQQCFDLNELMSAAETLVVLNRMRILGLFESKNARFDFSIQSILLLQEACDIIADNKNNRRKDILRDSLILQIMATSPDELSTLSLFLSKYWAEGIRNINEHIMFVPHGIEPVIKWENQVLSCDSEKFIVPKRMPLESDCSPYSLTSAIQNYLMISVDDYQKNLLSIRILTMWICTEITEYSVSQEIIDCLFPE